MSLTLWEYLSQMAKFYCPPVTGSQSTTTKVLATEVLQVDLEERPQFAIRDQGMIGSLLMQLQGHLQNKFITPEQKSELDRNFQPLVDKNGTDDQWTELSQEADVSGNNPTPFYTLHTDCF